MVRFRVTLGIAAASGCGALAHQLLWTHRMVDLLGATPGATTRILGTFFLGLSLGAMLAKPLLGHIPRPWRAIAAVEGAVAVLSLPMLTLPGWSGWLWRTLGPGMPAGWVGAGVQLLLSVLLVVPPALAMGMTLPLFARATLADARTLGRAGGWLYAANTAGGVLGVVAAFGLTLWGLGTDRALIAVMLLDVAIAVVALAIDRRVDVGRPDDRVIPRAGAERPTPKGPLVVAFLSGLSVLAAEVLAVHLFNQVVSLAMLGAAAVLIAVILPLAVAAALGPWFGGRSTSILPALAAVLGLACVAALVTPFLFVWQSDGLRYLTLEFSPSIARFVGRALRLGLVAFGPFVLVAGLVLPLTFRWFEVAGGDPYGRRWGILLAANGMGGLIGAELGNRVLMPALGMHLGFAALAAVYGVAAVATLAAVEGPWGGVRSAAGLALLLAAWVVAVVPRLGVLPLVRLDTWPGAAEERVRSIDLATGAEGTVAVAEFGTDRVILLNNQYVLGGTRAFIRQQRMALLPAVLHPEPRRVAFIGLGTGITAGAALLDPATQSVTAIELSPLVATMSRKHFGDLNGEAGDDPRLRVMVADGRLAMQAATAAWDLIVGDLFMPWQVGTGRLYSVEHFRAVRDALAEGGEFCQWLPAFQLTAEQFRVIVTSFRDAFPTAYLFRDDRSPETPAFALVGFRAGALDWSVVDRRTALLRQTGRTRDGFVAFPNLVRALYVGIADGPSAPADIRNTLDNGWIERQAALDQVGRRWRYLDADTWSLFPTYVADFTLTP